MIYISELNYDLETLNEKKLFQEEYDNEMYNWEREYSCSIEYGRLYECIVEYSGTVDSLDDINSWFIFGDYYDFVYEEVALFQLTLEHEFQVEHWLKKLDVLHTMRSDDPDEKFISWSSQYLYDNNQDINFYYYSDIFSLNQSWWTIQDLKDYLYEREHDEEYINQLRYERLKEILNSEFNYDYETLNEQQLFREAYDIEIYKLERENLLS